MHTQKPTRTRVPHVCGEGENWQVKCNCVKYALLAIVRVCGGEKAA